MRPHAVGPRTTALSELGWATPLPDYYGKKMDSVGDLTHPQVRARLPGMFDERCALQPDCAVVLAR